MIEVLLNLEVYKGGWSGWIDHKGKIECAEALTLKDLKDYFRNWLWMNYYVSHPDTVTFKHNWEK